MHGIAQRIPAGSSALENSTYLQQFPTGRDQNENNTNRIQCSQMPSYHDTVIGGPSVVPALNIPGPVLDLPWTAVIP